MGPGIAKVISFVIIIGALSLMMGSANALNFGSDEMDFSDLMALYNPDNREFRGLEPQDTFLFLDTISMSKLDRNGDTIIWFESTGGGMYRHNLTVLGDWTSQLKRGAKAEFNVTVISIGGQGSGQEWIECPIEGIRLLKDAPDQIILITDGDVIEVLGLKIDISFLPEPMQQPLVKSGLVLSIWFLLTALLWLFIRIIISILTRKFPGLDLSIIRSIRIPFFVVIMLYGLLISIALLTIPERTVIAFYRIYRVTAIILLSVIAVKLLKNVIFVRLKSMSAKTETKADDVLIPVLDKVMFVAVWVLAGIMVLDTMGVDVTVLIAGMGIAGLVIAFAAQDTLSNFFSGISLMLDRPFKEGDWIMMDDKLYQVREIGLRSTRMFHSFTNQLVTIPNNRISDRLFSNLSEPDMYGRTTISVGVSYGSDPRKVGQILIDEVSAHPDTFEDKDHATFYRFNDFGDSSLLFAVTFWVKDFNDQWRVSSELRERIFYRFAREGINIPFPQRVVHLTKLYK
ncbi:MAG: mechanosensitive ion channel [Candidatus Thermoplasmatota archaeon]|nr:mechanosensitive ion channel [Candidatus Thermoplasmatota archaeon]